MYEDYRLDMEETGICFEVSDGPGAIIWRLAPSLTCGSVGGASDWWTEGRGFVSQSGRVDFSLLVRCGSSLGEAPH